jgi:hypothetical protein
MGAGSGKGSIMRRVRWIHAIGFMLVSFLIAACGGTPAASATGTPGPSIAGSYGCTNPGDPDSPIFVWELRADGTLQNISPPDMLALGKTAEEKIVSGTWSVTGDSGTVTSENVDYPFTVSTNVEGANLRFADGSFVCAPLLPDPST